MRTRTVIALGLFVGGVGGVFGGAELLPYSVGWGTGIELAGTIMLGIGMVMAVTGYIVRPTKQTSE
ncbi:MAG TPA: hypothetical protein VGN56_00225 [Candidatus Paceibacterota bacterium]|jgi:hypothetical protein|nr:hypothetical protein [Candidatus Paceibacterota bacterium]